MWSGPVGCRLFVFSCLNLKSCCWFGKPYLCVGTQRKRELCLSCNESGTKLDLCGAGLCCGLTADAPELLGKLLFQQERASRSGDKPADDCSLCLYVIRQPGVRFWIVNEFRADFLSSKYYYGKTCFKTGFFPCKVISFTFRFFLLSFLGPVLRPDDLP